MSSILQEMTQATSGLLLKIIGTMQAQNSLLQVFTQASGDLSNAWLNGEDPTLTNALNQVNSSSSMQTFISTYLNSNYIYDLSQSFLSAVLNTIQKSNVWDNTAGPNQMNIVNQENGLVTATQQNETSITKSSIQMLQSALQADPSAGSPINDLFSAFIAAFQQATTALSQMQM
jgi:hypothetical protein